MLIPDLFIHWLAVAGLIILAVLFIIFILFGAVMDSLIAPTPGEETGASLRTKKEIGYDALT